jgi:O-antigen ligase
LKSSTRTTYEDIMRLNLPIVQRWIQSILTLSWKEKIGFLGLVLAFLGFSWSPFLVSASAGFLLLYFLLDIRKSWRTSRPFLLTVFALFLLFSILMDVIRAEDFTEWKAELLLIAGFVAMALGGSLLHRLSSDLRNRLVLLFLGHVFLISLWSVLQYLTHKSHYDELLAHGKHIDVVGGMNHIQFGVFSAMAVCLSAIRFLRNPRGKSAWVLGVLSVLLLINMHILSSRTGLLAVYSALIIGVGMVLWKQYSKKAFILGILCVFGFIFTLFLFSSSLQSKLENTQEDWKETVSGEDINNQSFGMRVESWKVAWFAIKKAPWTGYGTADDESVMQKAYLDYGSVLTEENRIHVHNQWLQYGLEGGIIKMLVFTLFLIVSGISHIKNPKFLTYLTIVTIASILSAYFSRQMDLMFIALFYHISLSDS